MSWVEVKKINSNFKKSLDVLIKEQFNGNNSNVNNIKNDINYIKSTQLGTNINNLLNIPSTSIIDLNNKTLVDKINYLLLCSGGVRLNASTTNILVDVSNSIIAQANSKRNVYTFTALTDGQIKIEVSLVCPSYRNSFFIKSSKNSNSFIWSKNDTGTGNTILNITKGEVLTFEVDATGSSYPTTCSRFRIFGTAVFNNPLKN